MKTTIDAAGRIVIPKALRDSVGLAGGSEVEIREVDGLIEIEPVATEFRIVMKGGIPVAVADRPIPPLTDEMFRDTLDKIRDERYRRFMEENRRDRS
jgi:AbrB family looped-hinge helix DNA binding protein